MIALPRSAFQHAIPWPARRVGGAGLSGGWNGAKLRTPSTGGFMSSDLHDLEAALQTYFDGLHEGDPAKLAAVFHDVSHLFSVNEGRLNDLSREAWFELVRSRGSAASQGLPRRDFIVHIDRSSPTTAFAKVECQIPPRYFTDYLTFVKLADGWKIVSKTFHSETR
jgi:hypothetical protein